MVVVALVAAAMLFDTGCFRFAVCGYVCGYLCWYLVCGYVCGLLCYYFGV